MKKLLLLALTGVLYCSSFAQNTPWSTSTNIGIGTTTPTAKLEISNAGNASLRVGISSNRANTHTQLIHSSAVVAENSSSIALNAAAAWDFYNNGSNPSWAGTLMQHVGTAVTGNQYGVPAGNQGNLVFQNVSNGVIASNGANIHISPFGNVSTSFLTNGNVGIGTTNPGSYKLAVEGTIGARKVKVTTASWADYVFEKEYQLPTLAEVEKYIQQHKHLPDVPSAAEVEKNGLDLGDSQAMLLKKIEELTLYIIEQNKQLISLQQEVRELKNNKN